MRGLLESMKEIQVADTMVTVKSAVHAEAASAMEQLADELASGRGEQAPSRRQEV